MKHTLTVLVAIVVLSALLYYHPVNDLVDMADSTPSTDFAKTPATSLPENMDRLGKEFQQESALLRALQTDTHAAAVNPHLHTHDEVNNGGVQPSADELTKLGYMLPPEYFEYDLHYLRMLAAQGDAYAMVHLAERYYFDIMVNPHHPYHDKSMNYPEMAKTSLQDALVHGNAHAAAILAEIHLLEKDPINATAWSKLSESLGDSMSSDWFKTTKDYQSLTPEQKRKADALAIDLRYSLRESAKRLNRKSLFDAEVSG